MQFILYEYMLKNINKIRRISPNYETVSSVEEIFLEMCYFEYYILINPKKLIISFFCFIEQL